MHVFQPMALLSPGVDWPGGQQSSLANRGAFWRVLACLAIENLRAREGRIPQGVALHLPAYSVAGRQEELA